MRPHLRPVARVEGVPQHVAGLLAADAGQLARRHVDAQLVLHPLGQLLGVLRPRRRLAPSNASSSLRVDLLLADGRDSAFG